MNAHACRPIASPSLPPAPDRLRALLSMVRLADAAPVDLEDPLASQALYQLVDPVLAEAARTPADGLAGLRAKAELVAWCCASRTDFALGETPAERLIASILRDLLAAHESKS